MQSGDDEDQQEKALSQLYDYMPEGLMVLTVLKDKVQRKQLGNCQFHPATRYSLKVTLYLLSVEDSQQFLIFFFFLFVFFQGKHIYAKPLFTMKKL